MKKLFAILTLAALVCGFIVQANAQTPAYAPVTLFSTAGVIPIPAQGATNLATAAVIDCRKQASVELQFKFVCDNDTTDNVTLYFQRSVDGTSYDTIAHTIGLAMTGHDSKTVCTNLLSYGAGYMRLTAISNAAATSVITNSVLKYAVKVSAP